MSKGKRSKIFRFDSEAAMCAAFIKDANRQGYDAYPECCGFDIVLLHREFGWRIGVEAKQQFNAHVVVQAAQGLGRHYSGPDFRAVLTPEGGDGYIAELAGLLGVTVIRARGEPDDKGYYRYDLPGGGWAMRAAFSPDLPDKDFLRQGYRWLTADWAQHIAPEPLKLPDYVPDVVAGASAPVALTDWKIRAIKIVVLLEKRGFVCGSDFAALKISPSRWTQGKWLVSEHRGQWIAGPHLPDFRAQHPRNFDEIAADFDQWSKLVPKPKVQGNLFNGSGAPSKSATETERKAS